MPPPPPDQRTLKESAKSTFSPVIILRGFELTVVGGNVPPLLFLQSPELHTDKLSVWRAIQNPNFWNAETFKQAVIAIVLSIVLSLLLAAPINALRFLLFGIGTVVDIQSAKWDVNILHAVSFIEKRVLQLPIMLMAALQHLSPALDNM